jgi:hypothetical protein
MPKGVDPLKHGTSAWYRRHLVHQHNGLRGSVKFAMAKMTEIQKAVTTTTESYRLAQEIEAKLRELDESLKTRAPWPNSLLD